jgi:hypothetical protein
MVSYEPVEKVQATLLCKLCVAGVIERQVLKDPTAVLLWVARK